MQITNGPVKLFTNTGNMPPGGLCPTVASLDELYQPQLSSTWPVVVATTSSKEYRHCKHFAKMLLRNRNKFKVQFQSLTLRQLDLGLTLNAETQANVCVDRGVRRNIPTIVPLGTRDVKFWNRERGRVVRSNC
jgi:hypothetical protein